MEDDFQFILDSAKESMDTTVVHFEKALSKIRAGRANPSMLDTVKVEYYGNNVPLTQVSNISTPDARTITVQPWERSLIPEIEKAILVADLGFNPMNNGDVVIINVPVLTEDRRRDLVKKAKEEAEDSRIGIRNARKDANDEIKKVDAPGVSEDILKDQEAKVQELTNTYIKKIDDHLQRKEVEIMKV